MSGESEFLARASNILTRALLSNQTVVVQCMDDAGSVTQHRLGVGYTPLQLVHAARTQLELAAELLTERGPTEASMDLLANIQDVLGLLPDPNADAESAP